MIRKRSREGVERKGKVDNGGKIKPRRRRSGDRSNQPRELVHGVVNSTGSLKNLATDSSYGALTQERCNIAKSHFRILEELLALWCQNLKCRGAAITNKKITAQALEIHRMLSGLLVQPQPGFLFTSGWLKRFKERHCSSPAATQTSTVHRDESWLSLDEYFKSFEGDEEDIFTCGITSMYLNALPAGVIGSSQHGSPKRIAGDPSASVLLCCNANGSCKLDPQVLGMYTAYHTIAIGQTLIRPLC